MPHKNTAFSCPCTVNYARVQDMRMIHKIYNTGKAAVLR